MEKFYSKFLSLTFRERLKAIGVTIWGAISGLIYNILMQLFTDGDFSALLVFTTWQPVLIAAFTAGWSYIGVTAFTNSEGKFMTKESSDRL